MIGTLSVARALARFLNLRGEQPDLTLANDIIPVVNAFSLDDVPYTEKRGSFFGLAVVGQVGNFGRIGVSLPSGDLRTICLRRLVVRSPGGILRWGFDSAANLGSATAFQNPWDYSKGRDGRAAAMYSAGGLPEWSEYFVDAGVNFEVPMPIVVKGGQSFWIETPAVNTTMYAAGLYDLYD